MFFPMLSHPSYRNQSSATISQWVICVVKLNNTELSHYVANKMFAKAYKADAAAEFEVAAFTMSQDSQQVTSLLTNKMELTFNKDKVI